MHISIRWGIIKSCSPREEDRDMPAWVEWERGATVLTEELLGRRVRAARKAAGLKQEDLAARIGVDQPTISRFEQGRDIGSILLTRIAAATNQDLQFFLRSEPTAPSVF